MFKYRSNKNLQELNIYINDIILEHIRIGESSLEMRYKLFN